MIDNPRDNEILGIVALIANRDKNDQAWIESFLGHLKGENPHLDGIDDPATMRAELDHQRQHYNSVRLHESIGYVTPDDEHHGRGDAIRKARREGLAAARTNRIATRRNIDTIKPKAPARMRTIENRNWLII